MTSTQHSPKDKLLVLAAVCLAALVLPLSFTGGAVATPAIGRALGGSPVAHAWVTNAFMLTFGSLLMAAGALSDQYGRKFIFKWAVALFSLTSVALSLASTIVWFDILRGVQGIAAAGALAAGTAALAQEFEGHELTKAFSLLGTTFGIGLAFGPLIAGTLIGAFGWQAVFLTSALIGVLALVFGIPKMRETRDPNAQGLDWPGTLSFTATLGLFTFGIIEAPESGWTSSLVVTVLLASLVALVVFVSVELKAKRPMLDLTLFRYGKFIGVQALPIGTCFSYIVLIIFLPLRFIGVDGMTELKAGLMMLALSTPMLFVPIVAASLTRWASAGALSALGFLVAASGLYWLSTIGTDRPVTDMVLPMLLIGVGTGFPWGLMDGLSVSVVPKERAGMAAGIFSTSRVAGEGITLAAASAILSAFAASRIAPLASQVPTSEAGAVPEAAQRMAMGSLERAAELLPTIGHAALASSYENAFQNLLLMMTGITVASAVIVFVFLAKPKEQADVGAVSATPAD
jgi:MFS family permease